MANSKKTLKSTKSDALSLLVPESSTSIEPETPKAIEPFTFTSLSSVTATATAATIAAAAAARALSAGAAPAKAAKDVPDGYVHFIARDEQTGTVFVTCQARTRGYVSAVIADSPLGLIVARWSRDHKGAVRYAKAINAQSKGGTPGMSGARVAEVKAGVEVPQGAVLLGRNREEAYYQAAGFDHGPNWAAREAARAARIAAFAAAQATSAVQGPVQEN